MIVLDVLDVFVILPGVIMDLGVSLLTRVLVPIVLDLPVYGLKGTMSSALIF